MIKTLLLTLNVHMKRKERKKRKIMNSSQLQQLGYLSVKKGTCEVIVKEI